MACSHGNIPQAYYYQAEQGEPPRQRGGGRARAALATPASVPPAEAAKQAGGQCPGRPQLGRGRTGLPGALLEPDSERGSRRAAGVLAGMLRPPKGALLLPWLSTTGHGWPPAGEKSPRTRAHQGGFPSACQNGREGGGTSEAVLREGNSRLAFLGHSWHRNDWAREGRHQRISRRCNQWPSMPPGSSSWPSHFIFKPLPTYGCFAL